MFLFIFYITCAKITKKQIRYQETSIQRPGVYIIQNFMVVGGLWLPDEKMQGKKERKRGKGKRRKN